MSAYDSSIQVFVQDDEPDPSEIYRNTIKSNTEGKEIQASDSANSSSLGVKRKFVADNGVKYVWDTEEDCWVVDEGEDDDDDDMEHDQHNPQKYDIYSDESDKEADEPQSSTSNTQEETKKRKRNKKKKRRKGPSNWIYITGLPKDITVDEIKAHFSKVGIIAISPYDQLPKIKIYKDEHNEPKGDCSLCYNAKESVDMAINYLDDGYIRPNNKIKVIRAEFDSKLGEEMTTSNSSGKSISISSSSSVLSRPKISSAQVKVIKSAMSQALSWNEDDDTGIAPTKALKIIVLQGMFTPEEIQSSSTFLEELEEDIASECSKCGEIEKITVFTKHPQGIVIVKYATSYAAQQCIELMNNRYFGGTKIRCFFWDGVTDYTVVPKKQKVTFIKPSTHTDNSTIVNGNSMTPSVHSSSSEYIDELDEEEREEQERIESFGDWIENQELSEEFHLQTE